MTGTRILIVDSDPVAVQVMASVLESSGMTPIATAADPRGILPLFREFRPDLVLLDLNTPGIDARDLIRQMLIRVPEGAFLPVAVLAAKSTTEQREKLLELGAADVIDKSNSVADLPLRLRNLLRIRELTASVEQRVATRTATLRESELEFARRLAAVAELGDYGDASHVQRVGRTSALLASELGLDHDQVELIRHAAPLHDIGKIAIPDAILLKSDPLTLDEWDMLKSHTTRGAQLLAGSVSSILQVGELIAQHHHEHWNGTGYNGLSGEDIPLVARIVTVADVFDALRHDRPYKAAWSHEETIEFFQSMRGQRFDPRVVDALLEVLRFTDLSDLGPDALPLLEP